MAASSLSWKIVFASFSFLFYLNFALGNDWTVLAPHSDWGVVDSDAKTRIRHTNRSSCQPVFSGAASVTVTPATILMAPFETAHGPLTELARGGESRVFEMTNSTDKLLLVPVKAARILRMETAYQRAHQVWQEMAKHPQAKHLMRVFSYEAMNGTQAPFLIVQRAEKGSLSDVMKANTDNHLYGESVQVKPLLRELLGLASILKGLHEKGWVHGDIKLDNILVTKDGVLQLGDLTSCGKENTPSEVMTPSHLSPQDPGITRTKAQDVVAFSRVVYEIALGKKLSEQASSQKNSPTEERTIFWSKSETPYGGRITIASPATSINPKASPILSKLAIDLAAVGEMALRESQLGAQNEITTGSSREVMDAGIALIEQALREAP